MDISIVIPIYNEVENINILHKSLRKVLKSTKRSFEIIYVDDGSNDGSDKVLAKLRGAKIIKFRRNFGQTAAMSAGFDYSKGDIVITMDGDLQNDPRDIPRMIRILEKHNLDVVCGWRHNRKDNTSKKLFSMIQRNLRKMLINDPVHDSGCTLRACKKICISDLDLMGEMHRYIPAILRWKGFRIGEMKVNHFPRKYGVTKYNYKRLFKGFMDLFNVWFWRKFSTRPLHIFGGLGILSGSIGFVLGFITLFNKIVFDVDMSDNFLGIVSVFMILIGIQFFISGLLADIAIKNYYGTRKRPVYNIEKIVVKK